MRLFQNGTLGPKGAHGMPREVWGIRGALLLATPLWSQDQSRKSAVAEVVEAMVHSYLVSFSQELAVKELERMAEKVLGESIDGKIGSALSLLY